MAKPAIVTLAFLAGTVVGYGLSILGYIIATSAGWAFDRDGGLAMSVAFMIGPVVAIVGGLVAIAVAMRWTAANR